MFFFSLIFIFFRSLKKESILLSLRRFCIFFLFSPRRSADLSPFCLQPRAGEGLQAGEHQDGVCGPAGTQFDFSPSNVEQLQEEDHDAFRYPHILTLANICEKRSLQGFYLSVSWMSRR